MKHILVPTDFSPAADNALAYAEQLAIAFSARLSIVHIYMIPVEPEISGALVHTMIDNSEALVKERADRLRANGLTIHTEVFPGAATGGIRQYLKDNSDVDLIVMGCQGEQAIPARFIGSTTTALLDTVAIPLLAVPAHFSPRLPQKIVWATDSNPPERPETMQPVFELLTLAKRPLSIFHREEKTDQLPPDPAFARLLGQVDYEFWHQTDDDEPLESAINDFVASMEADLLVMLHRRKGWFARLFQVSNSRREVWSASVPVLVMHRD